MCRQPRLLDEAWMELWGRLRSVAHLVAVNGTIGTAARARFRMIRCGVWLGCVTDEGSGWPLLAEAGGGASNGWCVAANMASSMDAESAGESGFQSFSGMFGDT